MSATLLMSQAGEKPIMQIIKVKSPNIKLSGNSSGHSFSHESSGLDWDDFASRRCMATLETFFILRSRRATHTHTHTMTAAHWSSRKMAKVHKGMNSASLT